MKNFIFKSIETDLQKIISIFDTDLDILKKNVVYCTYKLDAILKILKDNQVDKSLQKQVDEYFEDSEDIPDTDKVGTD